MSDDATELDDLLGRMAEEGRLLPDPDPEKHPSSGALYGYHEGKLPSDERLRVEEHLSLCGRCRDLLVEYRHFIETPVAAAVADFEVEAERRRMREDERDTRPPRTINRWAAVLATALVGLALYTFSLYRELGRAVTDSELTTLRAGGSQRSSDGDFETVRLPQFLVLPVPSGHEFPKYRLEFKAEQGRIRSIEDSIETDGTLRFFLPRRFLKPGKYQINVLGVQGTSEESLATYYVHILE
ncbi:MAG TPA: zf-HC2 domain-containing protein [Thermoanaerobaculia bacterium]